MINKIDAIIMNWDRPHLVKKTVRYLLKHPNINNIIISHCNKNNIFDFNIEDKIIGKNKKVINVNHVKENDEYGLACRFLCKAHVETDGVLILDEVYYPFGKTTLPTPTTIHGSR